MRHLGVNYRPAWLVHNKIMQAISEREEACVLRGTVQLDDACHFGHVSFATIADWAKVLLAIGCETFTDGLACLRTAAEVCCFHHPVVTDREAPTGDA